MNEDVNIFETLALPFREFDVVDVPRACRILGVTRDTLYRLTQAQLIRNMRKRNLDTGHYFIHYWSIVEYCDRLREQYAIRDRRPPLATPSSRYRDDDVLPFPMSDTITTQDVMRVLERSKRHTHMLFDTGEIESYKLVDYSNWRVSRRSLAEFLHQIRERSEKRLRPLRYRTSA